MPSSIDNNTYQSLDQLIPNLRQRFGYTGGGNTATVNSNPAYGYGLGSATGQVSGQSYSNPYSFLNNYTGQNFTNRNQIPTPLNPAGQNQNSADPRNSAFYNIIGKNIDPLNGIGNMILNGIFGGGSTNPPRNFYGSPFNQQGQPSFDPLTGYFQGLNNNGQIGPVNPYPQSSIERTQNAQSRALINTLPSMMQTLNSQILPNELAQLQSSSITSPAYAELQQQIYNSNALSNANTEKQLLLGPGADEVQIANALQRGIDPEYYKTRASTSDALNQALNSGMTGSEQSDIERGMNRQQAAQGRTGIGSNLQTVNAGLNYGSAGRQRLLQLLQQANQFTGQGGGARSGVDVLQQAVKSPSAISGAYSNVAQGAGNQSFGMGQQTSNNINSMNQTLAQLDTQRNIAGKNNMMQGLTALLGIL
jgi:hypothetical protein